MTGLVDDWDRYRRANPGKSSVVLARTRAEVRALSHLMRVCRFAALPDGERSDTDRVTVIVSRGTEDDRATSPLEIARGDRLRIGATHWEKQLFNGTVVTVEDFKVERGEAGTEPSVLISARTEDGREVRFHHDEIRDWYRNIRLDHGYAMTITSAQGLTVDRTFLLADTRPSRETIYPAATRHRERLDIYVNRAPLALDIANRRADNDQEVAVTDTDIRAYLAERWSRSQPKEAALDYMADGVWQDHREGFREDRNRSHGEAQGEDIRAAANDNALARIARDVRRTAFGWRHAQTVAAFADGRRQVLAAYDDLRERTRIEGDDVALSGAYRETLTRHAVLLKQAETFRARPGDFASLLSERGGIARKDLDAFEDLHAQARRHRRAATMRHVHRMKKEAEQEAQHPKPELRQRELSLEGGRVEAPRRADAVTRDTTGMQSPDRDAAAARIIDTVPPVEAEDYPWVFAAAHEDVPRGIPSPDPATEPADGAITTPNTAVPLTDVEPAKPDWYAPYEALQRDWTGLIERVQQTGEPLFYAEGYANIIPRIQALAENPDIPAETRAPMIEALENHQRDLSARQYVEDYLDAAERHMDTHASLQRVADSLSVPIVKVSDHLSWRHEADRLTAAAEAILADGETYGVHLDNMETGRARVERKLSRLRHTIREDGEYASKVKKPEPRSEPADTREKVEQPEPVEPAWMPAYEALRQDWNSLIEDARQTGTPSFYAKGYMDIIPRIRELTENPDIPAKSRAPLIQVLENHQRYLSTRKHILDYPGEAQRHMDARASLQDEDQEIELTGVSAYPDWRQEAERLTAAGEAILSGKGTYGAHLDRIVEARTHMIRALSALREVIGVDDKQLVERTARELRRLQNRHWVGPRFALDDGAPDPARAMSSSGAPVRAGLSRFGRVIGYLVGGQDYQDRLRTATFAREALERSGELKRDWNRQVERAAEEGVHVIYTDGYDHLHKELDRVSKNMLLDRGVESEISAVLAHIGKVVSNRNYFDDCREYMADRLDRREVLEAAAAERGVAVPNYEDYDTWRDLTDFAVGRCEELMDDPGNYGIHLDYIAHAQESLGSALARVRDVLEDDDRHLAATLAGQREGEDVRMREERVARLLDDPEKLRELRRQRAERKAERQQQSKGRHWSMRI